MSIVLGTVAAIGFEDIPVEPWLACFQRLGCTVVQAYRNQKIPVSVQQMQDAIAAGGMPCDSLHGVFGEEYDPSCPDEKARQFAVDTYRREGELSLQLGGPLVVVHCSTIREKGVDAAEYALRLKQLKKSIFELGEFGRSVGVRYAFENLPGYHPLGNDAAELAKLLDEVDAPNTGMCFDTGHANMTGRPIDILRAAARRVIYLHLSDNSGKSDDHEMPTYGTLDTDGIADALYEAAYDGTAMLEVFHSVEELQRLIDSGCGQRLADFLRRANGG